MARGKSIRKLPPRINLPRDNTALKITNYLITKGSHGARRNEIQHKAGIRKQEPVDFKKFLSEMCMEGWIREEKLDISGGIEVYKITDEGMSAVEKAKELLRINHPLTKLHAFNGFDVV